LPTGSICADLDGDCDLHIYRKASLTNSISKGGPSLSYSAQRFIKQPHPYLSHIDTLCIDLSDGEPGTHIADKVDLSLLSELRHLTFMYTMPNSIQSENSQPPTCGDIGDIGDVLEEIWEWLEGRKLSNRPLDSITFSECNASLRSYFGQIQDASLALRVRWTEA
jgi:hypothetical protein